jgi:hypothetical protein
LAKNCCQLRLNINAEICPLILSDWWLLQTKR